MARARAGRRRGGRTTACAGSGSAYARTTSAPRRRPHLCRPPTPRPRLRHPSSALFRIYYSSPRFAPGSSFRESPSATPWSLRIMDTLPINVWPATASCSTHTRIMRKNVHSQVNRSTHDTATWRKSCVDMLPRLDMRWSERCQPRIYWCRIWGMGILDALSMALRPTSAGWTSFSRILMWERRFGSMSRCGTLLAIIIFVRVERSDRS